MTETEAPPRSDEDMLDEALERDDGPALEALLAEQPPGEALRLTLELSVEDRNRMLGLAQRRGGRPIVEEAPAELAAEIVEELDAGVAASIVEELDSDDQVDLIDELDTADAEAILARMDPADAADVRRLIQYDSDTAGGHGGRTFAFRVDETVGAVLRGLTVEDEDFERYRGQHPYVVDAEGRLQGVVSLRTLLTIRRGTVLRDVMAKAISVPPTASIDELENLFDEHPFLGIPVTDARGVLIGVVSRIAIAEAVQERTESDSLKMQGVIGDEPLHADLRPPAAASPGSSANIRPQHHRRQRHLGLRGTRPPSSPSPSSCPWSPTCGCSGNQAVAVSLRELALGLTRPTDIARVWLKEISVRS
ncbi:MAG: CBS domain-containing protein [Geminicoccaceae bacterium]